MEIKPAAIAEVWAMRQAVMYPGEPIEMVKLPDDDSGVHTGVYEGDELLSVISFFEKNNELQFRKFATRTDKQGQGYGSRLLQYVMDEAVRRQVVAIWCNARTNAIPFYQRFGMQPEGESWEKWGHTFIIMKKKFR